MSHVVAGTYRTPRTDVAVRSRHTHIERGVVEDAMNGVAYIECVRAAKKMREPSVA